MNHQLLLKHTALLASILGLSRGTASAQAILKLTQVPAATPARDSLFVAGSFNNRNPRSPRYALQKQADGTYQISLPPSLGSIESLPAAAGQRWKSTAKTSKLPTAKPT